MAAESPESEAVRVVLMQRQVIDLTTKGRKTGQLRRIEIFLHYDDGRLFISGMPRPDRTRDWIHDIGADPHAVVHLKHSVVASCCGWPGSSGSATA